MHLYLPPRDEMTVSGERRRAGRAWAGDPPQAIRYDSQAFKNPGSLIAGPTAKKYLRTCNTCNKHHIRLHPGPAAIRLQMTSMSMNTALSHW
jgi:hypothetical protein